MVEPSRYNIPGDESVKGGVLKNILNIKDQKTLDDTETILLNDTYNNFLELLQKREFTFNTKLIFDIHKYFLGTLYSWAGRIRTVEISKNDVLFCASSQIKKSLEDFEKILKKIFPSEKDVKKEVAKKLSIIHCEFNAIHPFREGNGRTIRLFLDLVAVNLGFNLIDFTRTSPQNYIKACKLGMNMNYNEMEKIITMGLKKL